MRGIIYPTEAEARGDIAAENLRRGYPKTERGERVGGGRHVESVTTTSYAAPVETDDGRWAAPIPRAGDVAITPKRPDPTTVAGGAKPSGVRVVDAGRVPR